MITFVILAAVLTIAVVALVAVPLVRRAPEQTPAPWAAAGASALLVAGSAILYIVWSNWHWHAEPAGDSPQTMVARLSRKLEKNPNDVNGWLLLGRSYVVLEEYPSAVRSYERADRIAGGKNAEALVGEAEALVLGDETQLDSRAGRLVEKALQIDPNSGKALFFGGAAAIRRGDLPTARERFKRLLALSPPPNVKALLEQQITAIDEKLGAQVKGASAPPVAAASAAVRVTVTISPSVSSSAAASAPLFVFVRDPGKPGPPLAVKRLANHFPQTVELTAADSMLPGRAIAAGQKVQVVARIAKSGNPLAGAGDPFGEVPYVVGTDGLVNVVIDRLSP